MHESLRLVGSFGKTQRGRDVFDTLKKTLVKVKLGEQSITWTRFRWLFNCEV